MTLKPSLAFLLLAGVAAPLAAQSTPQIPQRVDRLEKEMRAVQRKVFPGGTPAFSQPEIGAPDEQAAPPPPAGNAAALGDLTSRVDSLERALQQLTNQVEQDEHRLNQLSEQSARDRSEFDTRLKAIEQPVAPAPAAPGAPAGAPPAPGDPAAAAPSTADDAAEVPNPFPSRRGRAPTPTPAADAAPVAAAAPAVTNAEDGYMAGYKLWTQKNYPAAEATLAQVARKFPKDRRASYARNLMGRAQLDDGKPATAAQTFLGNYQTDPKGERAAESLFYLGQALTQLKKTDNACKAYGELQDVYGTGMGATIKAKLPAARKAAGCA